MCRDKLAKNGKVRYVQLIFRFPNSHILLEHCATSYDEADSYVAASHRGVSPGPAIGSACCAVLHDLNAGFHVSSIAFATGCKHGWSAAEASAGLALHVSSGEDVAASSMCCVPEGPTSLAGTGPAGRRHAGFAAPGKAVAGAEMLGARAVGCGTSLRLPPEQVQDQRLAACVNA